MIFLSDLVGFVSFKFSTGNCIIMYLSEAMSLIKVEFKGKNILLGRNMKSLEQIEKEVELRFPGQLSGGAIIKFQGKILNSLEDLAVLAPNSANKSVKLEVEAGNKRESKVFTKTELKCEEIS